LKHPHYLLVAFYPVEVYNTPTENYFPVISIIEFIKEGNIKGGLDGYSESIRRTIPIPENPVSPVKLPSIRMKKPRFLQH
jgi:hypothetical protein